MIRLLRRESYTGSESIEGTKATLVVASPSEVDMVRRKTIWHSVSDEWNHAAIVSPSSKRILRPFIRRDVESMPLKKKLLIGIVSTQGQLLGLNASSSSERYVSAPLDYCYLDHNFLRDVNTFLSSHFWSGIDGM